MITGILVVFVMFLAFGVGALVFGREALRDWLSEASGNVRDRAPDRETVTTKVGAAAEVLKQRWPIALVLVILLCCCLSGLTYVVWPRQNVATVGVGSYVTLTDSCGGSYNVQIAPAHVEQGGVSVGADNCRKWYPLTAPAQ